MQALLSFKIGVTSGAPIPSRFILLNLTLSHWESPPSDF